MNMLQPHAIRIGDRLVGPRQPCFLIAEAGVNHNGDPGLALKLVEAAHRAGADAVKFQTFSADRLASPHAPKCEYQKRNGSDDESQHAMLRRLELPPGAHEALFRRCEELGLVFLSTPFDEPAADELECLGVAAYKTPSGEVTNLPYLEHVARKGRPMIVSTGMATLGEVEAAVAAIERTGHRDLVLLHCVSNYPAHPADVNLRAIHTLGTAFGVPAGYSDHTLGVEVALAATALGACVIEKHFTLDRHMAGPDHAASLEPDELANLVRGIRMVEAALGHGRKTPVERERETAAVARKSLVAARDIPEGALVTDAHIAVMRPGTGLPPAMRPYFLARRATAHIPAGALLTLDMVGQASG